MNLMKIQSSKQHKIDTLFPVILFFVFALCALTVLLLSANIYESTTKRSTRSYNAQTGLSYVREKIHQMDENGSVRLGTLEDTNALILTQTIENVTYSTYIYTYQEELKELYLKEGSTAKPEAGTTILKIQNFRMEELSPRLFRFTCTDTFGHTQETLVAIRSTKKISME